MSPRGSFWILCASVAMYLASLLLDVIVLNSTAPIAGLSGSLKGFECLLHGGWLLLDLRPAWLANPLWLIALITASQKRWKLSITASFMAFTLGLTAFGLLGESVRFGPGGSDDTIVGFGEGYYAWLFSLISPALLGGLSLFKARNTTLTQQ